MIKKSFLLLLLSAPIFYSNMSINASVPIAIPCEQEIAVPFFAELSELYPSQMRYSSHNVEQKLQR